MAARSAKQGEDALRRSCVTHRAPSCYCRVGRYSALQKKKTHFHDGKRWREGLTPQGSSVCSAADKAQHYVCFFSPFYPIFWIKCVMFARVDSDVFSFLLSLLSAAQSDQRFGICKKKEEDFKFKLER